MTTVLVVDDSALMRKVMRSYLQDAGMEVVTASGGVEALAKLEWARPDVVTLDIHMPDMDGLSCLSEIMARQPVPVVMVSMMTFEGAQATVHALEMGAVDYVAKPDAAISLRLGEVRDELVGKVRRAAATRPRRTRPRPGQRSFQGGDPGKSGSKGGGPPLLVLVGASTGGPGVVMDIVRGLPAWFPPVVVAQHLPATFTGHFARRLDALGEARVRELTGETSLEPCTVYIARGDADVLVARRGDRLVGRAVPASTSHRWHPSVDRLVRSALAAVPARRLVGVLLTGMGDDGASAMAELSMTGGRTIAEAEESAVVWGMPGALVRRGGADAVLPADAIGARLAAWLSPGPAGAIHPRPRKEDHDGTRPRPDGA